MSALGILARAGHLGGAELCPHPESLQGCAISIPTQRGFICCPTCLETLQDLIASWHGGLVGPRDVYAQMFALGYTRGDALRFILQLLKDQVRVRLGLLRPEAL